MLLQFRVVSDDSLWICDTQFLQWAKVSASPDPAKPEESVVLEKGKLVPKGFGVYGLDPRTPKDGLSTIGTYVIGLGQSVKIYIRANTPVKDFTMPVPIRQVLYEILANEPNQIQQSIQEMTDAEGKQEPQPQGSQESRVEGSLPETTAGEKQPEVQASVGRGNEELGSSDGFSDSDASSTTPVGTWASDPFSK